MATRTQSHPTSWLMRVLVETSRPTDVVVTAAVAFLMGVCYAAAYAAGGANYLAASWFCLPVVLAGAHFRYVGVLATAVVATLLAGPLLPLDVGQHVSQSVSLWSGRGAIFVLIGLLSAAASQRLRSSYDRELGLAQGERDLAVRKAAVIETVSHQFRSPLSVIRGVVHALEQDGAVTEDLRPLVGGLESSSQRLVDLVTAVSAVLEVEEHATLVGHDMFSTRAVLAKLIDHLGISDPHARVSVTIERSAGTCVCDAELLSQLMRHLIENAVKFSDDAVEVHVARPTDDTFAFSVSDRGPGIEPSSLALASEPFAVDPSTHVVGRGLGLGLFASLRIADVLGGSVTFEDRPGGGTVARATIPATSPEPRL
jgi:signal transduction histidine kinase